MRVSAEREDLIESDLFHCPAHKIMHTTFCKRHSIKGLLMVCLAVSLSGCGIWEHNVHPDYQSTRADYICHPYGDCFYGQWVPVSPEIIDPGDAMTAHAFCMQEEDHGQEHAWWKGSVTRGVNIGECMEQRGFRLRQ